MTPQTLHICQTVSRVTGVPLDALLGRSRVYPVVYARQVSFWLAFQHGRALHESMGSIAAQFGIKRWAVEHGVKRINGFMESYPAEKAMIERLRKELNGNDIG